MVRIHSKTQIFAGCDPCGVVTRFGDVIIAGSTPVTPTKFRLNMKLTFTEIESIINSIELASFDMGPVYWLKGEVMDHQYFRQHIFDGKTVITNYYCNRISKAELFNIIDEKLKLLGEFQAVDSHGGSGRGDEYWRVYYFKDHDIYIEFFGWYNSYSGAEFESMYQVRPKTVELIKYFKTQV